MHRRTHPPALPLAAAAFLWAAACDNVGRAFDPIVDPSGPNPTTGESAIQVVPTGGDAREGRPKVKSIAPKDGGWPATVPIVVEFTESVNEASIAPTTAAGTDGRIVLRVEGTTQVLPCLYDFLAGGRVLVMRPVTELSNEQTPTYEVVLLPEARDVDGLRFSVAEEGNVLTTFQVNQAQSFVDGRILATYPRDNQGDAPRETDYVVVFDRPANASTITASNFVVRPAGGAALAGNISIPLEVVGQPDARVASFRPDTPLAGSGRFELVVDDTMTFGVEGQLDFRGRTPYAVFDTVGPQAPTAVHVANPTVGFADKINRQNLPSLMLQVTTPADALAGDRVVARIYGFDRDTNTTGEIAFVERSAVVPAPGGQQSVVVDFSGELGTVAQPAFEEGGVDFAVQMQRGNQHSGYLLNDPDDEPILDVTPPSLTAAGPPGSGNDIVTDLEHLAFHGTASEEIGEAMFTDGVNPAATLFGGAESGYFAMNPVALGRLTTPRGYTLTITDRAGNMGVAAFNGTITQRGSVTGTVAGTLVVEAYDHATLQPIAGATVLVDPGVPTVPATGQVSAVTDGSGLATFTGLAGSSHTVTVVAAGYDLTTFYDTPAARLSLPLRPTSAAAATATLAGNVLFQPTVGTSALVGNNAFDDPLVLAVATTTGDPTEIPPTPITANRPQVVTAFGGTFEPTMVPAFTFHGYQMLGPMLSTPVAPEPPAAAGSNARPNVVMLPSTGTTGNLAMTYTKDFALSNGLDTANLLGGRPTVRVTASLFGFTGQALAGVGFATSTSGAAYSINATYGLPMVVGFASFSPSFWIASEARDTGGRVCRHRALLVTLNGTFVDLTQPPGIPVITAPAGPSTGSPLVTFADELDAAVVPGGVAVAEVRALDPDGRRWTVFQIDGDTTGGTDSVQFPDLQAAAVTGLANGTWSVRVDARVWLSLSGATGSDFVLSERIRQEASYARSATQDFTVQ